MTAEIGIISEACKLERELRLSRLKTLTSYYRQLLKIQETVAAYLFKNLFRI